MCISTNKQKNMQEKLEVENQWRKHGRKKTYCDQCYACCQCQWSFKTDIVFIFVENLIHDPPSFHLFFCLGHIMKINNILGWLLEQCLQLIKFICTQIFQIVRDSSESSLRSLCDWIEHKIQLMTRFQSLEIRSKLSSIIYLKIQIEIDMKYIIKEVCKFGQINA